MLLESEALRLAFPKIDDQTLRRGDLINRESEFEPDPHKWAALNWEFHSCIYQKSESFRLIQMIKKLYSSVDRYLRIYLEEDDYRKIARIVPVSANSHGLNMSVFWKPVKKGIQNKQFIH